MRNSESNISNRLSYLDFAAGVMILRVLIHHAVGAAWNNDINFNLLFPYIHFAIPWFFYKSGMFFKKSSLRDQVQKDCKKILRTFLLWSLIGYIFYIFIGIFQDTLTLRSATYSVIRGLFLTGKIPINDALWFLLTLLIVRCIANLFLPKKK